MKIRSWSKSLWLAAPLVFCAPACMFTSSSVSSLEDIDTLLTKVERVFVDAELTQERVHEAMDALHFMTDPRFRGDAVDSYEKLQVANKRSSKQGDELRRSVKRMRSVADEVFEAWAEDLGSYSNGSMRRRSHQRLEDTRRRYQEVLMSVQPALALTDAVNSGLEDHETFLGNDFNASAVSDLQDSIDALDVMVVELDEGLMATLHACQAYVGEGALHGQLEPAPQE